MKLIKNGKVLGKINIIDLLVVLVVLAAVVVVGLFLFKPEAVQETLIVRYIVEEVIISSLIASIGGLVTCANSCLK